MQNSTPPSSRYWRIWRRRLMVLAVFITIIALFYAEEDLRGRYAWQKYKREALAKGIELNRHAFEPAPVPDEENFAATPFFAVALDINPDPLKPGQTRWRDTNAYRQSMDFATNFVQAIDKQRDYIVRSGQLTDLNAAAAALQKSSPPPATRTEAANQILSALQEDNPVLEELRTASHRPSARYNILYDQENPMQILLPHLAMTKRVCQVLMFRASAELALSRTDTAFDDLGLMLSLTDSLRTEPFMISQLVRIADLTLAQQIIWEGLATRSWSDRQLQELENRLGKLALLNDAQTALRYERAAYGTPFFELLRKNPKELERIMDVPGDFTTFFRLMPSGWIYLEQVSYNRFYDDYVLPGYDAQAGLIHPHILKENQTKLGRVLHQSIVSTIWHHRLLSAMSLPALEKFNQKTSLAQTSVNETIIACALERHRLSQGTYPETLDALSPAFIVAVPRDIINGGPLKYQRTEDGQFLLYSVGWNEKDDGGKAGMSKDGKSRDIAQGDWVWPQYPAR